MSPPLISPYKKPFAYRRICQALLGGVRIFSPVQHIIIQILIFSIPIPIVLCATFTEYDRSELIVGICLFLIDVSLSLVIFSVKKSARVGESRQNGNNFLDQDEEIIHEGCLKASTWITIAPNVNLTVIHFVSVMLSAISFSLCSPLIFQHEWSTITAITLPPVWLRCFSVYTLCNARYSSVISSAPEIATFESVKRRKDILFRVFYTAVLGALLCLYRGYCTKMLPETTVIEFDTCAKLVASALLSLLPLLWGLGILPPLDALLCWSLEMFLRVIGGNPSVNYFATVIAIFVAALSFLLTFVAGSVFNPLILIVLQCILAYFVSLDAALLLNLNGSLCEDTPPQKLIWSILKPCAIILTSTISIIVYLLIDYHDEIILTSIVLSLSATSILVTKICFSINDKKEYGFFLSKILQFYNSILKFILHCWIAGELAKLKSDNRYSLINLLEYLFNIRAFTKAIIEPKYSSIDFVIATLVWQNLPGLKFTLTVFIVSVLRSRIVRVVKYLKMVALFTQAAVMSPLLSGMKISIAAVSISTFPLSIASLAMAAFVEGATVTPIFTLPIFLIGFPRPISFWKGKWFGNKKEITNEIKSLDNTIYSQIAPGIAKAFVRKARNSCLDLEEGNCYIARQEDRLLFFRILTYGWNYVYIQVKGLEMQEQTSCHHQEAAWLDEVFEAYFSSPSFFKSIKSVKNSVIPLLELQLSGTYSESKSVVYKLKSKEEKSILKGMFFRAFSYLWIESNPVFKGESYSMRTTFQFSPLKAKDLQSVDLLEPVKSDVESVKSLSISKPKEAWSYSPEEGATNNNQQDGDNANSFEIDTDSWIKLCVGQVIPSNAVKNRVEKLCESLWKLTDLSDFEDADIDLELFFSDSFEKKAKGFKSDEYNVSSEQSISLYDITLKAGRYATKLTLDEIYNGPTTENLEIFQQLTIYERDYGFVKYVDLPYCVQQKSYQHIVTMIKYEETTVLKMFSKNTVTFHVGQINRFLVEGIWANLNLELMYLTSDDDERFSIQHDRKLLRNICTQCASAPLGYPVYDSTFRVSNNSVDMI